ncbi:MAG: nucleotidyltransferase family protein [Candidatus Omnitrophica bacterium]|nr:nucleotidyltransferase family protein [Candidatus Omnitrophota bacterium]
MKAIILAAGYGTRLYPLTIDKPKALLDIGGKTILERLLGKVSLIKGLNGCYLITNQKFYKNFSAWALAPAGRKVKKSLEVIDDGTSSNESRLGAIGDICLVMDKKKIDDDILVMGSDNLFEFDLTAFVDFCQKRKGAACLALYDIGDLKKASLYGIAMVDAKDGRVTDFQEKPKEPRSTLAATAIYFYPRETIRHFNEYLATGLTKDAPGNFIKWLAARENVYGFIFKERWYDIGDLASLEAADKEYRRNEKGKHERKE